jgi:hypothetical protein
MLQLDNRTPFAAERTIVMDKTGEKSWVVAVKGTYRVFPDGSTEPAEAQTPPLYSAEHFGEPGKSSIRYEADLIPTKPATDVIVNGHAYAPDGRPVHTVDVTIRAGPLTKTLRVFGDRRWYVAATGRLRPSSPASFERMPIIYERAFGGWDKTDPDPAKQRMYIANPIGSGFATTDKQLEGHAVPNVEYPDHLISAWNDRPAPAGFGAIASYWSPRLEWGGTYDEAWMENKFPLLPDDFDGRFHQCAPPDQQVDEYLRGGELVVLENLTASGSMQFALPKVSLAFSTRFGKQTQEHRASLQTVVIEPDVPQVILVWHTSLACHHLLDDLDETIVREKRFI